MVLEIKIQNFCFNVIKIDLTFNIRIKFLGTLL